MSAAPTNTLLILILQSEKVMSGINSCQSQGMRERPSEDDVTVPNAGLNGELVATCPGIILDQRGANRIYTPR